MKKFSLLCLAFVFLMLSCSEEEPGIQGCTNPQSFNYNADATQDDGSCKEMAGCLGYTAGLELSGTLSTTLNNEQNDRFMNAEVAFQREFWGNIPAEVYILNEPDEANKNAYATSDGRILFGYYMFYYLVQKFSIIDPETVSPLPVSGALAHEWGHRAQFTIGWNDYEKTSHLELEADFLSGYYMGLGKQWYWDQIQTYYNTMYALGDYNYNSPNHHGTPQQRLDAAYAGLQTAVYALNEGISYTYNDLHGIFKDALKSAIGASARPNLRSERYPEVTYPDNLTEDYVEKLFPRTEG